MNEDFKQLNQVDLSSDWFIAAQLVLVFLFFLWVAWRSYRSPVVK